MQALGAEEVKTKLTKIEAGLDHIEDQHAALAADSFQVNCVPVVLSQMLKLAERLDWRPLNSNLTRHVARHPDPDRAKSTAVMLIPDQTSAHFGALADTNPRQSALGTAFRGGLRPRDLRHHVREPTLLCVRFVSTMVSSPEDSAGLLHRVRRRLDLSGSQLTTTSASMAGIVQAPCQAAALSRHRWVPSKGERPATHQEHQAQSRHAVWRQLGGPTKWAELSLDLDRERCSGL